MRRRMARRTVITFSEQLLEALACAHRRKIAHMDVKPENLILFPENRLRLADFGLARVIHRTLAASGSGTVGYLSPEQALGKPSLRSDVFSTGLILWRLMSGTVPEWPFAWPYPKAHQVEKKYSTGLIKLVRKSLVVDERKRYPNANSMLNAYRQLGNRVLR
jgi:serine/threonine-protein kinase